MKERPGKPGFLFIAVLQIFSHHKICSTKDHTLIRRKRKRKKEKEESTDQSDDSLKNKEDRNKSLALWVGIFVYGEVPCFTIRAGRAQAD